MLGMVAFCLMRNVPNDIYFKIGLVTVIGLAAKNAILIVEFAVDGQKKGKSLYDAVMDASKLRLRPDPDDLHGIHPRGSAVGDINGGRCGIAHEIGTGVIGGMLFADFPRFIADPPCST